MWTSGFTNVTVAGQVGVWWVAQGVRRWGGFRNRQSAWGGGVARQQLCLKPLHFVLKPIGSWWRGEHKFPVESSPPSSWARPIASLLISGLAPGALLTWAQLVRQLWRRRGVPHIWPPGLHKSEAKSRQLGQSWQMQPLEGSWKFITKHIGILGCSWFRFSGVAGEAYI